MAPDSAWSASLGSSTTRATANDGLCRMSTLMPGTLGRREGQLDGLGDRVDGCETDPHLVAQRD